MRSLPAVQWNTAGRASGAARADRAPTIWGAASSSISVYWVPRNPGRPLEVLRIGQGLDEGEVVEGHRVRLHVEAALLHLVARAQVDHRADPELAHDRQVGLGQLAEAVGPEQDPPPGALPVPGGVAAEVAEVDRPFERR